MTGLPQLFLTFLGLLFCAGDVAILGVLLTWQERAPTPSSRRHRFLRFVLPAAVVLVALLLLAFVQIMLLWSAQ
ncbi:hypothetical protein I2I05_13085 [Hymenobacter sp. BT683]|uniref:Uncharacterized protein n=1 Tax=Hymenobacter jeongseonensis TaxID=2791027 RepID=A0ABS0IJ21_9BACT|nr:hypothetical protein [Hymenobacter jeongseonensis]MBF9238333.1 hypothetical protein [Hymenobacter jeongseonensis]